MSIFEGKEGRIESSRAAEEMAHAEKPHRESLLAKLPILKGMPEKKAQNAAEEVGQELEEKIKALSESFAELKEAMQKKEMQEALFEEAHEIEKDKTTLTNPEQAQTLEEYPKLEDLPKEEQNLIKDEKSYAYGSFNIESDDEKADESRFIVKKTERHRVKLFLPKMKPESNLHYKTYQENIDIENLENPDTQEFLLRASDSGWTPEVIRDLVNQVENANNE